MHASILPPQTSQTSEDRAQSLVAWPLVIGVLVVSDGVALLGAFTLAYLVRFRLALPFFRDGEGAIDFYTSVIVWALPVWLAMFACWRLYDRRTLFAGLGEYARVVSACSGGALAVVLISFLYDTPNIARAWLVLVWCISIALMWVTRFLARRAVRTLRAHGHLLSSTVVVGTDGEGTALAKQLSSDPGSGIRVLGLVEGSIPADALPNRDLPIIGSLADLEALIEQEGIEQVVIATGALTREEVFDLYARFGHRTDVDLRMSSGLFEVLATGVRVQHAGNVPLMSLDRIRITGVDAALKALLDYVLAAVALAILSPVLLVLAILVRLDTGGPIIHRRRVVGRSGQPFYAFKLCTMIPDRRTQHMPTTFMDRRRRDNKAKEDPRITRMGKLLRRSSLDELPQLINVLRGEMSLIGPRMVSPDEIDLYGKLQLNLLTVKPGITGPWQVRGRSDIAYAERVRLSTEYIRNYSIWLDLQILLQTVPAVLKGKGAY
jgi:exopolysaccharide biosynthesis polyprenyl glycosylphosphotransferase